MRRTANGSDQESHADQQKLDCVSSFLKITFKLSIYLFKMTLFRKDLVLKNSGLCFRQVRISHSRYFCPQSAKPFLVEKLVFPGGFDSH